MHTWEAAERVMRREAAATLHRRAGAIGLPPLAVVGGERPAAVIALGGLDPDRPTRTFSELVLLAAAFRPNRVLVGRILPDTPARRCGLLIAHDLHAVLDGRVELLRAWRWHRCGGIVAWLPAQARRWEFTDPFLAEVASAVIDEVTPLPEPELLSMLLARSAVAGHRVTLAPRP
jgi:hypothetical protein